MRRFITFRHLTIANHLLPAIVNDDPTGLEDGDNEQLDRFLTELEAEITAFCKELSPDRFFSQPYHWRHERGRFAEVCRDEACGTLLTGYSASHNARGRSAGRRPIRL